MSKLRWFGFGTSGQNQTFGSIQTRSVMLIFISSFKILIIFNSGRIKQTCATLVFRKILTLLRMWRHHSASLQKYSKVEYIKERPSPYLCCRTAPLKENRKSKKKFSKKGVLSVCFLCLSVCLFAACRPQFLA